jgi:DNA-binding transcriptional MerR regulator
MSTVSYTIDELASLTGVPSRTIRFYQAKKLLPAPERNGRVAYYGDEHAERLRLIAELQDRGLRLSAVRDFLSLADRGRLSVDEWMGVSEHLQAPWSEDAPRLMDQEELAGIIGDRKGVVGELTRAGIVERQEGLPVQYLVRSPGLLRIALDLVDAGIDVEMIVEAQTILRRRLARAAAEGPRSWCRCSTVCGRGGRRRCASSLPRRSSGP